MHLCLYKKGSWPFFGVTTQLSTDSWFSLELVV
jgi:hypothetical protein